MGDFMKIFYDNSNIIYSDTAKKLNNAVTVYDNGKYYAYEFKRINDEALIITKDKEYIVEAVEFYHNDNNDIYKYYTEDNEYYQEFDKPYIYKLPINIIRPTRYFIEKEKLIELEEEYDKLDIKLPVCIIDDEYFLLDGHKRLLLLKEDQRMVNVYLKDIPSEPEFLDLIYILREYNYKTIDDVKIYDKDEINEILNKNKSEG